MTTRMLIDARHREETRVAVVKGNRIEEFDFESAERKQLKGNIYLAKVTRVEPSLQAAFVDYGGNRHGFLAFSEIHPDYYQIPKEDREALLREEAEHAAEEAALRAEQDAEDDEAEGDEADERDPGDRDHDEDDHDHDGDADDEVAHEEVSEGEDARPRRKRRGGGDDAAVEALRERRMSLRRRYKIQDVIRRRQVLLVQVVKEERGNKGAALTTYLSLAGRYCVLMPNTAHGGGISRKISNASDRKRLKSIMADLNLPSTMGCIVRTAGLQRTKTEIKRDFDYLARLWDGIRETTLQSAAPALVYGDSDLLKRAIRDIYNKDIDEIIVEGEDGYRQAREFMKLLMPSHARRIKHYSDPVPLFQRAHVEDQLSAMYHPVVQLKSGGYLVINPTEALVSIDINSGRSTREHNIEQTATATNLEAAQEIARQLRLRDMAGLVVIDFIDMDHGSNVRKVEKAMKEALKNDRARIQVGRISSFGLMEMSRQRLRTGVLEASTRQCPHCEGTGLVRTASSAGLSALRLIEDEAARGRGSQIVLRASQEAAFYLLNRKRAELAEIEDRYGVTVEVTADGEIEGARMAVEASGPPPAHAPRFDAPLQELDDDLPEEVEDEIEEELEEDAEVEDRPARRERERSDGEGESRGRRRRRRGRRGRSREEGGAEQGEAAAAGDDVEDGEAEAGEGDEVAVEVSADTRESEGGSGRKRRRRGRRGGRREFAGEAPVSAEDAVEPQLDTAEADVDDGAAEGASEPLLPVVADEAPAKAEAVAEKPKRSRRRKADAAAEATEAAPAAEAVFEAVAGTPAADVPAAEEPAPKPKRTRRRKADAAPEAEEVFAAVAGTPAEPDAGDATPAPVAANDDAAEEKPKPRRRTSRKKAEAEAAEAAPAADTAPAAPEADAVAESDAQPADDAEAAPARRGWWQRTFGN
ncbi:ribonuclease E [Sphingomonas guangdongensis]|uniref:Ribonuclease E n=1 Tax=Sphingomonas guangdongensis TaxID=1141890 RepID=A0A285QD20_9SPHN|nr:ribonuclease E/G [Sphingomonas guangdongensis]SOB79840.1 ribonuclease E [Sphingomonas guangdongensis]